MYLQKNENIESLNSVPQTTLTYEELTEKILSQIQQDLKEKIKEYTKIGLAHKAIPEIAEKSGVKYNTIIYLLEGVTNRPHRNTVVKIYDYLYETNGDRDLLLKLVPPVIRQMIAKEDRAEHQGQEYKHSKKVYQEIMQDHYYRMILV